MTLLLELEIKTLLEELRDPEAVAEKLIKLFEDHPEDWSHESLTDLSRFLLSCGLYQHLVGFCIRHLNHGNFIMPWAYFIEALNKGLPDLEEDTAKFIVMGIEEEKAAEQVCLAEGAERFLKKTGEWRAELKRKRRKRAGEMKQLLLDELLTLRTQQLYEQEKFMLGKLQRMFPGDQDILEEIREHKERYALDILSRRSPLGRAREVSEPPIPEDVQVVATALNTALLKMADVYPEMTFDFAVAAFMIDEVSTSLALLEKIDLTTEQRWFYLEVKLRCRHFLEVLAELSPLELKLAHEPETFFATAYLRAQAYWGLEQKHVAIEILESILAARPSYRSSSVLLDLWRSQ